MTVSIEDVLALEAMETRIRAILPSSYGDSYEDVLPVSMGSAPLKYDADGRVAWNQIWGTFCDLAMAGGPPHRGTLLQPAPEADVAAAALDYDRVVKEICRGISLVTGLPAQQSSPGWISVECRSPGMAGWLARAIVMENVLARHEREMLHLPAGPDFRLGKEIKNVITAMAKTCHYWGDHMAADQQRLLEAMIADPTIDTELLEPALLAEVEREPDAYRQMLEQIAQAVGHDLGLPCFSHRYYGWIGVECPNVGTAVWMMRAMMVENVLARREGECLFLPVNTTFAYGKRCERLVRAFARGYRLGKVRR